MTPLVEIDHVSKTYRLGVRMKRVDAVRDLSFAIGQEGIVGFVGPNGAGKTTTIKMLLGLVRPSKGTLRLYGIPSADPQSRARVAYVSEQPYFYTHLSIEESLRFVASLRGVRQSDTAAQVRSVLETVGLAEHAVKKVRELSKGMQQRLNMAQALLGEPELFIFDEPMSGMDPPGRSLFRRIFLQLRDRGKTVFFSTHILDDVEALCARVVVLSRGACTYDGSVATLLERGFEGTEMTVSSMPQAVSADLSGRGCECTESAGSTVVFVPAGTDPRGVQDTIARAGLYCSSIAPRRKSLETLLYASEGVGNVN